MTDVPQKLQGKEMFVALCEGLRWWFAFDGPQTTIISQQEGRLTADDVRRIAILYNFMRNLPADPARLEAIGAHLHPFAMSNVRTLDDRAAEIEPVVEAVFDISGTRFRLVSGTTKLLWFAAPDRWTPYDRLASAAVRARYDGIRRMRDYYRRLDAIGFLSAAGALDRLLDGTEIARAGGTRILDKFLMMRGDTDWTRSVRPIALAFAETLPPTLKRALVETGERLVHEPSCQLDFGALK